LPSNETGYKLGLVQPLKYTQKIGICAIPSTYTCEDVVFQCDYIRGDLTPLDDYEFLD